VAVSDSAPGYGAQRVRIDEAVTSEKEITAGDYRPEEDYEE
jgi:hypothetical protein